MSGARFPSLLPNANHPFTLSETTRYTLSNAGTESESGAQSRVAQMVRNQTILMDDLERRNTMAGQMIKQRNLAPLLFVYERNPPELSALAYKWLLDFIGRIWTTTETAARNGTDRVQMHNQVVTMIDPRAQGIRRVNTDPKDLSPGGGAAYHAAFGTLKGGDSLLLAMGFEVTHVRVPTPTPTAAPTTPSPAAAASGGAVPASAPMALVPASGEVEVLQIRYLRGNPVAIEEDFVRYIPALPTACWRVVQRRLIVSSTPRLMCPSLLLQNILTRLVELSTTSFWAAHNPGLFTAVVIESTKIIEAQNRGGGGPGGGGGGHGGGGGGSRAATPHEQAMIMAALQQMQRQQGGMGMGGGQQFYLM